MCQLLGVCSNMLVDIDFSLREFKKRGASNPHGFGFVFYEYGYPHLFKEPSSLDKEDITKQSFRFLSKIIIGHVRLASCGGKAHRNTHPFVQEKWSFAHNGTVIKIKNFKLENFKPLGETDSEYAFCYLLDKIYQKKALEDITATLRSEASKIELLGRFNFLLSDGEYLFAYGDDSLFYTRRAYPFQAVTLRYDGYNLHLGKIKGDSEKAIIVVTEPLTEEENWEQIKGLKVFKDGEMIDI